MHSKKNAQFFILTVDFCLRGENCKKNALVDELGEARTNAFENYKQFACLFDAILDAIVTGLPHCK